MTSSSQEVSRRMKGSAALARLLRWSCGECYMRGLRYRVDAPVISDKRRRVDIAFISAQVAVFVDGCFWHGCPQHATWPASNADSGARRSKPTSAEIEIPTHNSGKLAGKS